VNLKRLTGTWGWVKAAGHLPCAAHLLGANLPLALGAIGLCKKNHVSNPQSKPASLLWCMKWQTNSAML